MKNSISIILLSCSVFVFLISGCSKKSETLFSLVPADKTGVEFINSIVETDSFNILTYEYLYNGGGIGIADFNNDGKQDVFFTGNQVPNNLYLNNGNLEFTDITEITNVNVSGRWNSGVSIIDINNDGWMDIYVCATMHEDSLRRKNMLFINKGLNKDGTPTFIEKADEYGLGDTGFSVSSAFFDYDKDGDLDVYILTNQRLKNIPSNYRLKLTNGSSPNNDRLYRNNGNGTFSDVSMEAGISIEGFGLGLAIADVNNDGWPDIYVSNDYLSNDLLYINNKNGTFKNQIGDFIGHQSQFSMGNDAADINNDGLTDIVTLDMLPEINIRKKTTIGNKSYQNYINNRDFGYEYQYVRNMLHINNGLDQGIKFSEVGQLSGVYQTEWSWSPLFADFDNDGNKDLFITNGFPKDITDKDFAIFRADKENIAGTRYLLDSIPVVKISNYAYKNKGDLNFTDVTKLWGLDLPSFSNGAAFADLDNDGDLDYIVNNINDKAFVYRNNLNPSVKDEATKNNFLRIKLVGPPLNKQGIGAKVSIFYDGTSMQYSENYASRGFLSSVEDVMHFGLGKVSSVDSIIIEWPDSKFQLLKNIKSNQVVPVTYSSSLPNTRSLPISEKLFINATKSAQVFFKHVEEDKIDFNLQRTLPHKFSQSGPGIAVGDINNDGLEDFVIGGSSKNFATIFFQKTGAAFEQESSKLKDEYLKEEDEGLLLFDADNDNDLDLYIVSGSLEHADSALYQDRLYLNDGKGNYTYSKDALPKITASGSCVRAADFDKDGDLDLFIGGRVLPGVYPFPAKSYILRNDGGKFSDITRLVCADLETPGMVSDALWTDFNQDGDIDLILVGEFMPITFFANTNGKLTKISSTGVENYIGWWNSLVAGDFDKDGDTDYIAGNLGLNNNYQVTEKYPIWIYAKDFDGNGSVDPILACYMRTSMENDEKDLYPVHFWEEINSQSTKFRGKFSSYKQYGQTPLQTLLSSDDLKGALMMKANHMASSYIENLGNGKFRLTALPSAAQTAPINGMITEDVNQDGNLDVVMVGNDYGNEVFAGRYDAFNGLVLLGDSKGNFSKLSTAKSGFYVPHDAKALVHLFGVDTDWLIASQNQDSLMVFSKKDNNVGDLLSPDALDTHAILTYENGQKQMIEFYYGSGYLSQSTRKSIIPRGVKEILVFNSKGASRKVDFKKR
jgi:enediyne biosynthesis protein E4